MSFDSSGRLSVACVIEEFIIYACWILLNRQAFTICLGIFVVDVIGIMFCYLLYMEIIASFIDVMAFVPILILQTSF